MMNHGEKKAYRAGLEAALGALRAAEEKLNCDGPDDHFAHGAKSIYDGLGAVYEKHIAFLKEDEAKAVN